MSGYQHIFFDLDRTLWDFDTNSRHALSEIFEECKLEERGIVGSGDFILEYQKINMHLWDLYRQQKISKELLRWRRFDLTLKSFGISDEPLAQMLGDRYIAVSPLKTGLLPGTIDVLNHLASRYRLHIITNGFEEVQHLKLSNSGLSSYFDVVVTSDGVGCKKPGREIFEHACEGCGALASESIMIGDDLDTDILGAQNAGMDHVYFNPLGVAHSVAVTHEIKQLVELKGIL